MDAVELILQDHREVEDLFSEFENDEGEAKASIAAKIIRELTVHAKVEETEFYPAIRKKIPEGDPLIEHSLDEHQEIKDAIAQVNDSTGGPEDAEFTEAMKQLKEVVQHHVKEEETEMLPRVEEFLDQEELQALGERVRKAKAMELAGSH